MKENRRGLMIVLSSPSGAGKSTLTRKLLAAHPRMSMSISATTRDPRSGEKDGEDYYFISKDEFASMRDQGAFLEYAKVFDNYYGTPRTPVEEALEAGRDVIFDIDWQGAQQLTQAAGDDLVKIFILPPSKRELERRLKTRAQDSAAVIAKRMAKSESEMSHWAEYDYVIVNADLDQAMDELSTIIGAERMKRKRQFWLSAFVGRLMSGLE
ncbi:MAG TPA: guanylate kinase [Hellea balneolensis]|uniref:Guanylate kinase n=1 Tax=Hellea balneolensis TaxID=287478 RepID=A0A7C5R7J5_9PROT|nr:guanylate kinase [Hellea balneolensis]